MHRNYEQLEGTRRITFGGSFISFISDSSQSDRIHLSYHFHDTKQVLYAQVTFGVKAQGPPGFAHGGAISAVFDELMGATCWLVGFPALTAQFTTRYFATLPLNTSVLFECEIRNQEAQKITLDAKVTNGQDNCYASARGLFIAMDQNKLNELFKEAPEGLAINTNQK